MDEGEATVTELPTTPRQLAICEGLAGITPAGPTVRRRMSELEHLFADATAWQGAVNNGDPVVYEVAASPIPEAEGELPQSITTIYPGDVGGELYLTKGHIHTAPRGEIYIGLSGVGGLLTYDGHSPVWIDIAPYKIGYIPPGWAHRSVNVGESPYRFLAVYPGDSGHDYNWVLEHGMGHRVMRDAQYGHRLETVEMNNGSLE